MTDLVYGIEFGATHAALVVGERPGSHTGIGDPEPIGSEIPARVLGLLRVRAQARVPGTPAMVVIAVPASWDGQRRGEMAESAVAAGFDRARVRVETSGAAVAALGPGPAGAGAGTGAGTGDDTGHDTGDDAEAVAQRRPTAGRPRARRSALRPGIRPALRPRRQTPRPIRTPRPRTSPPSPDGLSVADTPTPEYDDGQDQAEAIDDLLDESASSRSGLSTAISDLSACRDMDGALSTVSSIGDDRDSQASTARDLEVDALDDGYSLRDHLVELLEDSAAADEAFHDAGWSYQDDGCSGSITDYSSYDDGVSYSEDAGAAKAAFVDLWNPVAESYGLSTRSRDEI
ncbi:hypothetical protein [Planotetraspora kaengkrachanensis]|uniref:Uncharacterized protein n=1 Tax=Planotetraspora kaengkrachanensis TaxID=575193 RepID=A0A8J3PTI3_9ACTN|nr:hypothetical protein [Planotetraspora kaengkrachanensis]GIG80628.1 hypothetical protein Pka01_37550 [Planotetraspora kaengkrachanensis]